MAVEVVDAEEKKVRGLWLPTGTPVVSAIFVRATTTSAGGKAGDRHGGHPRPLGNCGGCAGTAARAV